MWREAITGWAEAPVAFGEPASEAAIQDAEQALGKALPAELVALLRECDGVEDEDGLGLIWPIRRIVIDNLEFRTDTTFARLYMPFEPLLFFADAGNGDQFCFVMRERPADVFAWFHETDSRTMVAPSLEGYLEWTLDGRLTL